MEDNFPTDGGGRGGSDSLGMIQVHYIYCELYFCRVFLVAQLVKNPPAMQETLIRFLGQEDYWRRDRLPTPVFLGFPCGSAGKESTCNVGDLGSILGLGRSPGGGYGNPS